MTDTTSPQNKDFFGHPGGLSTLFFTEMWERMSYYGMRVVLVLFMVASISAGGLATMKRPPLRFTHFIPAPSIFSASWVAGWPTALLVAREPFGTVV